MTRSEQLFEQAREYIPGGVNSPVRAFRAVGGTPLFIERADGPYIYDADGKKYIDYVLSWGPMILGHNHPAVREAVIEKAQFGLSFGAPTAIEVGSPDFDSVIVLASLAPSVHPGPAAPLSAKLVQAAGSIRPDGEEIE